MNTWKTSATLGLLAAGLLAGSAALAQDAAPAAGATSAQVGQLRLIDKLDREDSYCLDIMGSGRYVRFDLPMTAHNCKPGLYADEAVTLDGEGRIVFPAYGACATVAGLNKRALPMAALVPRECGENTPFMDADELQRFDLHADGRLELRGSGLCVTAGEVSASTFEATHRWRTLYVDQCERTEAARARWHFVPKEQIPGAD